MAGHAPTPAPRRWWQRIFGSADDTPYGLPDSWVVVEGPAPRTEVAIGPGGAFLLDHRRSRAAEVARLAGDLSGRLTARLGRCVTVHGVLVEEAQRPVRADQPHGITIVTAIVLGPWLQSHPKAFDDRQVRRLAGAVRPGSLTSRTG